MPTDSNPPFVGSSAGGPFRTPARANYPKFPNNTDLVLEEENAGVSRIDLIQRIGRFCCCVTYYVYRLVRDLRSLVC